MERATERERGERPPSNSPRNAPKEKSQKTVRVHEEEMDASSEEAGTKKGALAEQIADAMAKQNNARIQSIRTRTKYSKE